MDFKSIENCKFYCGKKRNGKRHWNCSNVHFPGILGYSGVSPEMAYKDFRRQLKASAGKK